MIKVKSLQIYFGLPNCLKLYIDNSIEHLAQVMYFNQSDAE